MSTSNSDIKWRLILNEPANGAWNMAVDEAILTMAGRGEVPSTLRLYAWDPPCLSLGQAQGYFDVDLERLYSLGWDIVRRPTGGKAILHTDELTYSIIGSYAEELLQGSLLESYQKIAKVLFTTLNEIGINATIELDRASTASKRSNAQEPICFENPSKFELTVDHKKLIGSAQARRKEGILQHGSIPLFGDIARITQVLTYPSEDERITAARRLRKQATTVVEELHRHITWEKASQAFISSFEAHLGIKLFQSALTPEEIQYATGMVNEKYANQQWTFRQPLIKTI